MEWSLSPVKEIEPDNRNRCLNHRLGGSVSRSANRRALVSDRESHAHQLPGTAGSSSGNKVLCQGQRPTYPSKDRQHYSTHIHKQVREHSLPNVEQADQRTMALVPREEHNTGGHTSGWCSQLHSRRRVAFDAQQIQLDALSQDFQEERDQSKDRTTSGGPVCIPSNPPAQGLCELEARSRDNGNRCLHPRLDKVQGLRKSPVESCGESSDICQEPTGSGDTDSACLESTGLVPSPVGDVDSGTTPAPRMLRSGITDSQGQQTGHNPPLAAWVISGRVSEVKTFQSRLQNSSWPHGGKKLHGPMTPCLGNWFAGVTKGIQIPFRVI